MRPPGLQQVERLAIDGPQDLELHLELGDLLPVGFLLDHGVDLGLDVADLLGVLVHPSSLRGGSRGRTAGGPAVRTTGLRSRGGMLAATSILGPTWVRPSPGTPCASRRALGGRPPGPTARSGRPAARSPGRPLTAPSPRSARP